MARARYRHHMRTLVEYIIITWNVRFDEKIVEYKDPNIPIGYDENMVLEEVEKAIKLYEENKDLDTGNMEVSEDEEESTCTGTFSP